MEVPPGKWLRQASCAFSQVCAACRTHDTQQSALRRQADAAGSTSERPRRIVVSFNGDMKGLLQIAGHAGPNATHNCLFCLAHKNQTNIARGRSVACLGAWRWGCGA